MTPEVNRILRQTDALSVDEQLALAALLIERARRKSHQTRRNWLNVMGAGPYPLTGEDAQAWVTRTREEGDDERERQCRH
ncbi:MAG: hypothetical protein MOB07_08040 [Acidobacteria bacterium]|nr:hypothetical protein [Acidobacteriota bacterium]